MRKQLKGMALLLFGILLAITGVATEPFSVGENYMLWCVVGIICGIVGIVMVFAKEWLEVQIPV